MNTMESILQSDALQALGWTLVHAVWQIAGLAFLLMLTLAVLRGRSPGVRYGAALATMIAVVAMSAATFVLYYRYFAGIEATPAAAPAALGTDALVPGSFESLKAFLYRYLYLFIGVWLCGVIVLTLRFAGSLYVLRRLRLSAVPASYQWSARVNRMAGKMGIGRAVQLAESALVAAPVMIGHLKPLILLPAGMLAAIPADQVEAILAHELAHIRRGDFLINLVQSVAEIIYFFHPGIWWISSVVRREREQCCDDMAMRGGCHPVTLAFALSEVGEWMQAESNGKLVMAFAGKKEQPLLARVKRLLGQEPPRSSGFLPAGTVTLAVIAFLLLSGSGRVFSSSAGDKEAASPPLVQVKTSRSATDTLPAPREAASVEVRNGRGATSDVNDTSGTGQAAARSEVDDYQADLVVPRPPQPPQFSVDMSEMPKPPVPDSIPGVAVPAPPSPPVFPDSASWSQFQQHMEGLGAAIADWTKGIHINDKGAAFPGVELNFDKEQMKEFERSMEDFGKEMEQWGEAYGKQIAAWAKANEPKMKEFEQQMKRWEEKNQPRLKEFEREMEAYGKEMEQYQQRVEDRLQRQEERSQQDLQRNEERLERERERLERNQERLQRNGERADNQRQDTRPENNL